MSTQLTAKTSRILFRDYWCFLLFLGHFAALFFVVTAPLVLVLLPLLIVRVKRIKRTIEKGEVTQGVLAEKRFARGEWILWYVYKIGNETFKVRNVAVAFKLPVSKGDVVSIAYDPQKPSTAYLPALYAA